MGALLQLAVLPFADRWLTAAAPAIAAAAISDAGRQSGGSRIESTGLHAAFAPTLKSPLSAAQPHSTGHA